MLVLCRLAGCARLLWPHLRRTHRTRTPKPPSKPARKSSPAAALSLVRPQPGRRAAAERRAARRGRSLNRDSNWTNRPRRRPRRAGAVPRFSLFGRLLQWLGLTAAGRAAGRDRLSDRQGVPEGRSQRRRRPPQGDRKPPRRRSRRGPAVSGPQADAATSWPRPAACTRPATTPRRSSICSATSSCSSTGTT